MEGCPTRVEPVSLVEGSSLLAYKQPTTPRAPIPPTTAVFPALTATAAAALAAFLTAFLDFLRALSSLCSALLRGLLAAARGPAKSRPGKVAPRVPTINAALIVSLERDLHPANMAKLLRE